MIFSLDHVAAGGNRHPSAADWKPGLLAFGAGKNLALWEVDENDRSSVKCLLAGHSDAINVVTIYDQVDCRHIITGSVDRTIRIWASEGDSQPFGVVQSLDAHSGSINSIAIAPENQLFVSGAADGTVKVWEFSCNRASLVQSITLQPRLLPLTCALRQAEDGSVILAVAGTSSSIQLYSRPAPLTEFRLQATLTGHEGWIRSLDFATVGHEGDVLLASASQDKYIRLWRLSRSREGLANGVIDAPTAPVTPSLSNKTQQVGKEGHKYSVTFEALLIGHEDWIYTVRWAPPTDVAGLRLLSASADNSLAIWQADESSGIWVCQTRLGEISSQKGSTTATGSTGGFWIGLWQPSGNGVASVGRTGSWRIWRHDASTDVWQQYVGISGHVKEVQGLTWTADGDCLLSASSDQTTRLWAEWKTEGRRSRHEFARPQIHGYDLNCITSLTSNQFVSGADEKLLRVFNKPKAIDELLSKLCGLRVSVDGELPDAANIPVLGLSNKAIVAAPEEEQTNGIVEEGDEREAVDPSAVVHKSTLNLDHPPLEDHLARHTLWPEHEKLYGHGYEISAVAANADGSLIATACKASSIDHAVIRLYECQEWREVKPSLKAHSLTVTSLAFSPDSKWLLSVGRDRQWAVFRRESDGPNTYAAFETNPKGHSRMVLDCSWAPSEVGAVFATAGRDRAVKIWKIVGEEVQLASSIAASAAVTAVDIWQRALSSAIRLAYGTEGGGVSIVDLAADSLQVLSDSALSQPLRPSAAVNALRWRPGAPTAESVPARLAIASDDCSLRIVNVQDG